MEEIAIIALITSIVSIFIGISGFYEQRKHYRLSFRPIGDIQLEDYLNRLVIKLENAGMGSMIITSIKTTNKEGEIKRYPIEFMPEDIVWTNFNMELENRAIKAGDSRILLEYTMTEDYHDYTKTRDYIRSRLSDLTIIFVYTDIYGKEQPPCVRELKWFGRHELDKWEKVLSNSGWENPKYLRY